MNSIKIVSALVIFFVHFAILTPAYCQPLGQRRPVSVSDQQYARTVFSELRKKYSLQQTHPHLPLIEETVRRLAAAARVDRVPWQIFILNDRTIRNAAAIRGNYIFVWSGLLDVVQDQELMVILTHSMAHVFAGHCDPDPVIESQQMLIELGTKVGHLASGSHGAGHIITGGLSNIAKAITHRKKRQKRGYYFYHPMQEKEADRISITLAADAAYDPQEVLYFWMRARKDRSFEQNLQFFRRHRPDLNRLHKLGDLLEQKARNKAPSP